MEIAAIVAAVIALRFYPFPFIVMIIAFALWFMSMDLTPWIFGRSEFTWEERRAVSMWFGLGVLRRRLGRSIIGRAAATSPSGCTCSA